MADDVTLTEAEVDALLACDCGHDIGGEHNSNGCYHIDWSNDDAKCDCLLSDDQDVADLVGARVSAIVAARVAAERERWVALATPLQEAVFDYDICEPERAAHFWRLVLRAARPIRSAIKEASRG